MRPPHELQSQGSAPQLVIVISQVPFETSFWISEDLINSHKFSPRRHGRMFWRIRGRPERDWTYSRVIFRNGAKGEIIELSSISYNKTRVPDAWDTSIVFFSTSRDWTFLSSISFIKNFWSFFFFLPIRDMDSLEHRIILRSAYFSPIRSRTLHAILVHCGQSPKLSDQLLRMAHNNVSCKISRSFKLFEFGSEGSED